MTQWPSTEERFWAKVEPTGFCWEWTSGKDKDGYGVFGVRAGKNVRAHRMAYEILVGPIPDGMVMDHLCQVRHCVNPDHLEPVTPAENIRRGRTGWAKKVQFLDSTHCPKGHEFTTETLVIRIRTDGRTRQVCRICTRASVNQRRALMGRR